MSDQKSPRKAINRVLLFMMGGMLLVIMICMSSQNKTSSFRNVDQILNSDVSAKQKSKLPPFVHSQVNEYWQIVPDKNLPIVLMDAPKTYLDQIEFMQHVKVVYTDTVIVRIKDKKGTLDVWAEVYTQDKSGKLITGWILAKNAVNAVKIK